MKNFQQLLDQLSQTIDNLASDEAWIKYLKMQQLFYNYSFHNTLLILNQCPEATRVAGYHTWKNLGRKIKQGEKPIWIKAPMKFKDKYDNERVLFRFVPVFDISQTEGKELFEIVKKLDQPSDQSVLNILKKIANKSGFQVIFMPLADFLNGDCSHQNKIIRINSLNSTSQQIKTLLHEITHALAHFNYTNRRVAEIEAESVAYIICSHLGIDSTCYSSGYLLTWGTKPDITKDLIKASCKQIQKISSFLIGEIQSHYQNHPKDKVA